MTGTGKSARSEGASMTVQGMEFVKKLTVSSKDCQTRTSIRLKQIKNNRFVNVKKGLEVMTVQTNFVPTLKLKRFNLMMQT